jgi:hypothetical protein
MTKTMKFQQVPFIHFVIWYSNLFRVSIFGFCLNMTFRSGTTEVWKMVRVGAACSRDATVAKVWLLPKPRIVFSSERAGGSRSGIFQSRGVTCLPCPNRRRPQPPAAPKVAATHSRPAAS